MIIIGIGNKARQGKDTVGNFIGDMLPAAKFYFFAKELKLYCKEHHNELLIKWQLAHQTKKVPAQKEDSIYGYNAILQWYGSILRAKDPNYLCKKVQERIEADKPGVAIITDVRFPNECEFVKNLNGTLVQVIRRNEDGSQYIDPDRDPNHESEIALDDYLGWDFYISARSGDLEALKSKTKGIVHSIIGKRFVVGLSESYPLRQEPPCIPDATGCSN